MNPKLNSVIKFLLLLGIGFAFALASTQVRGEEATPERSFRHSLLGSWVLDQKDAYNVIIRWVFYPDVNWETRRMGYLVTYYNGELASTIQWSTQDGRIEVRPNDSWKWIHSTEYRIRRSKLYIKDASLGSDAELAFTRVCDSSHARKYCNL